MFQILTCSWTLGLPVFYFLFFAIVFFRCCLPLFSVDDGFALLSFFPCVLSFLIFLISSSLRPAFLWPRLPS